jgi:hypothetical protein
VLATDLSLAYHGGATEAERAPQGVHHRLPLI